MEEARDNVVPINRERAVDEPQKPPELPPRPPWEEIVCHLPHRVGSPCLGPACSLGLLVAAGPPAENGKQRMNFECGQLYQMRQTGRVADALTQIARLMTKGAQDAHTVFVDPRDLRGDRR